MPSPSASAVPTWPELVISMSFGEIEEGPFTGLLRIADGSGENTTVRVFKRFGEYRIETTDGELLAARRHGNSYQPETGLSAPTWDAHLEDCMHLNHGNAIERRRFYEWLGDDFTYPTGPIRATTFLGRPSWEVELAPPEHKTSPLTLTIDAATGMELKAESRDYWALTEWLELDFVSELDDELFAWDGLTITTSSYTSEARSKHVADEKRAAKKDKLDRKWLRNSGIKRLRLRCDIPVNVHTFDPATGEFEASTELDHWTSIARRRTSDEPWSESDDCRHEARWRDDEWEWRLRSDSKIQKRTLKHLRKQTRKLKP